MVLYRMKTKLRTWQLLGLIDQHPLTSRNPRTIGCLLNSVGNALSNSLIENGRHDVLGM
jgi:hypothetical protein